MTNPEHVAHYSFYPHIKDPQVVRHYKSTEHLNQKKTRDIFVSSHKDACIYSWYAILLTGRYEEYLAGTDVKECVIAYRQLGKNNIDFSKKIFDFILAQENCVVLAFDIKNFFDKLDHKLLKSMWHMVLHSADFPSDHYAVYNNIVKYHYVDEEDILSLFCVRERKRRYGYLRQICSDVEFRRALQKSGKVQKNKK